MNPSEKLPISNEIVVQSVEQMGKFLRAKRKEHGLTQKDMAGIGNTGNRVIVEIENGKKSVQIQKVLDLMGLLGLEMTIRERGRK